MSGNKGAARKRTGGAKGSKKQDGSRITRSPEEAREDFERYGELLDRARAYLEAELERVVQEKGNSAEAIRLSKHFREERAAAEAEFRRESGGTAPKAGVGWLERGVDPD